MSSAGAAAQEPAAPLDVRAEVFAGSELESYLRLLQLTGKSPGYPWSLRGFSPAEVDRLAAADPAHPWAKRYRLTRDTLPTRTVRWVRPEASAVLNSAFPFGTNDGPLWAGRGVTTAVQGGFAARRGPLSLTVDPILFVAQNAEFGLADNGRAATSPYTDWRFPGQIDVPQRFGSGAYARLDPGQSTLRLDAGPVALGFSTANQAWGPADQLPLILGTNAPGYPHAFLGTSHPLPVGIGRVHARIVWGSLVQSPSGPMPADSARRFTSGLVAVFIPRGIDGLEVGASRFFHSDWQGLRHNEYLKPLEGLLKSRLGGVRSSDGGDVDNQLASVFARWVFPRSGFEAYGEFAREDHSYDLRDLALEPDHDSGFMLGLQKAWLGEGGVTRLRAEILNARVSWLFNVRDQAPFYVHNSEREGHTERGQILGSPAAFGGAGGVVALDRYHPHGRWTLAVTRTQVADVVRGASVPSVPDVMYTAGAEALWFRGRVDVTAGTTAVFELNRYRADDAFNLNAVLKLRVAL